MGAKTKGGMMANLSTYWLGIIRDLSTVCAFIVCFYVGYLIGYKRRSKELKTKFDFEKQKEG